MCRTKLGGRNGKSRKPSAQRALADDNPLLEIYSLSWDGSRVLSVWVLKDDLKAGGNVFAAHCLAAR